MSPPSRAPARRPAPPRDVLYLRAPEQAAVLLKPLRLELLRALDRPRTCPELAARFRTTPQRVYYHVKALERAGLVARTGERRVRGAIEGFYQAAARSYRLAPQLVHRLGGVQAAREQSSLAVLAGHAERLLEDVAALARRSAAGAPVPSLSLGAEIALDHAASAAFLAEVEMTFRRLAERYGARDGPTRGAAFRLSLACYPTLSDSPEAA